MLKGEDPQIIKLISSLLTYDPEKRLSASEALNLPIFDDLKRVNPDSKYSSPMLKPDMFEFEFENFKIGKDILKELIMDEILLYNSDDAKLQYMNIKREYPNGCLEQTYTSNKPLLPGLKANKFSCSTAGTENMQED